jgi:hypothetical protein
MPKPFYDGLTIWGICGIRGYGDIRFGDRRFGKAALRTPSIKALEPIPTPHIDDWISVSEEEIHNWVSGSLEERIIAHNKFVSIISLEDLFVPIIGPVLNSYYMDSSMTHDFNHLNIETNKRLLDHILLTCG